jgi:hypothetical protein
MQYIFFCKLKLFEKIDVFLFQVNIKVKVMMSW